ncbi:SRPBCC family protein [Methylocapsa sp. D3K7]|uniref:SRPBCC family protein n=1 Tax=Methylocapsa sp. D3K7 TaxID=3041435 RepID=UPI00244EE3D2|nr:SRPBCC family protein [Methylocapsa sp. D3K7]WGJ14861.1 SRPBCC family protein [Methylocapsa sp. D3K7]
MTIIILIIVGIIIAAAAVFAYAAAKPNWFHIKRSLIINAPPEKIFPLINDLGLQAMWSPFEKDANMRRNFSGPAQGKGAAYEWDGNRAAGAGRIVIADSTPPSKVVLNLHILRPFKAQNIVEFTLASEGRATHVTWAMKGQQPYMAKLASTFINCDKMVGKQFEEGLAKLNGIAVS